MSLFLFFLEDKEDVPPPIPVIYTDNSSRTKAPIVPFELDFQEDGASEGKDRRFNGHVFFFNPFTHMK